MGGVWSCWRSPDLSELVAMKLDQLRALLHSFQGRAQHIGAEISQCEHRVRDLMHEAHLYSVNKQFALEVLIRRREHRARLQKCFDVCRLLEQQIHRIDDSYTLCQTYRAIQDTTTLNQTQLNMLKDYETAVDAVRDHEEQLNDIYKTFATQNWSADELEADLDTFLTSSPADVPRSTVATPSSPMPVSCTPVPPSPLIA